MTNKSMKNNQVFIIQQIIPKYRDDFFLALSRSINIEIYASYKGIEKSITSSIDKTEYVKHFCPKFRVFDKLIFQFIPFVMLSRQPKIIFEFNLRIISNILLLILRIILNKKNILWTHGITKNMSAQSIHLRLFFLNRAHSIIVYEDNAKKVLSNLGIQKDKIFVAKNSLNFSEISKFRNSSENKFRITYIGRLTSQKNIYLLCEAFLSVIDLIKPNIILTIIGNGPELKELKNVYSSNNIEFIGELLDEESIAKFMNQTLFLVSPDYLGLMIIHGFCYAVPVLVNSNPKISHSPEIELFKDGENGFYFDGSQTNLELMLVKCSENPKLLSKYGLCGFDYVKNNYGVEVMVKNFINAINHNQD
jgi:glycosyltransferase involved in cell wall biosynthesis